MPDNPIKILILDDEEGILDYMKKLYLIKPIDTHTLLETVNSVTETQEDH